MLHPRLYEIKVPGIVSTIYLGGCLEVSWYMHLRIAKVPICRASTFLAFYGGRMLFQHPHLLLKHTLALGATILVNHI